VAARNNRAPGAGLAEQVDEAIAEYGEALKIDQKYLLAYNNRACLREQKGDLAAALAAQAVRGHQGPAVR
jgi:tetratricopeptide (TPR) repeat protein